MKLQTLLLAVVTALLLSACGSGPVRRVSAPTASIQELNVQADGSWKLLIRVQNFSNVPMTFNTMRATLEINDIKVGLLDSALNLDVPGESADVLTLTMNPASSTSLDEKEFSYMLYGSIESSDPQGSYEFERKSRLSPAPGLPGTWR